MLCVDPFSLVWESALNAGPSGQGSLCGCVRGWPMELEDGCAIRGATCTLESFLASRLYDWEPYQSAASGAGRWSSIASAC